MELQRSCEDLPRYLESIRAKPYEMSRQLPGAVNLSELPDVVIDQRQAIQLEDHSGVWSEQSVHQQFPCHSEVEHQNSAIQLYNDIFPEPGHAGYRALAYGIERTLHHQTGSDFEGADGSAHQPGSESSDDSFHLR